MRPEERKQLRWVREKKKGKGKRKGGSHLLSPYVCEFWADSSSLNLNTDRTTGTLGMVPLFHMERWMLEELNDVPTPIRLVYGGAGIKSTSV